LTTIFLKGPLSYGTTTPRGLLGLYLQHQSHALFINVIRFRCAVEKDRRTINFLQGHCSLFVLNLPHNASTGSGLKFTASDLCTVVMNRYIRVLQAGVCLTTLYIRSESVEVLILLNCICTRLECRLRYPQIHEIPPFFSVISGNCGPITLEEATTASSQLLSN
jgi:hypothetical protein